jgi:hypothetical protein
VVVGCCLNSNEDERPLPMLLSNFISTLVVSLWPVVAVVEWGRR